LRDGIATGDPGCPERLRSKLLFSEDFLLSPSDLAQSFFPSLSFLKKVTIKTITLERASFGDFHGEAPQKIYIPLPPDKTGGKLAKNPS